MQFTPVNSKNQTKVWPIFGSLNPWFQVLLDFSSCVYTAQPSLDNTICFEILQQTNSSVLSCPCRYGFPDKRLVQLRGLTQSSAHTSVKNALLYSCLGTNKQTKKKKTKQQMEKTDILRNKRLKFITTHVYTGLDLFID